MAGLTANFSADFSRFKAAVDQAQTTLKSFEDNSGKVTKSLDRMSNALSGTRLIQDATLMAKAVENVGGVSKLTEQELQRLGAQAQQAVEKMQKLGIGVPQNLKNIATAAKDAESGFASLITTAGGLAGALGVGFGVGAIVGFGKSILDDADALTKLSDKTGVTIEGLERFRVAGDEAGNSIDDITRAVAQMENRLVGGDASAVSAIGKLGLSLSDVLAKSPEDQFIAISDAIRQIKNPAEQVNLAVDIFGKTGAEVLPTLKRGFDDLKDSVVGMSDDTARKLDEAGDKIKAFVRRGIGELENLIVKFAELPGKVGFAPDRDLGDIFKTPPTSGTSTGKAADIALEREFVGAVMDAAKESEIYEAKLRKQEDAARQAADAQKRLNASIGELVEKARDLNATNFSNSLGQLKDNLKGLGENAKPFVLISDQIHDTLTKLPPDIVNFNAAIEDLGKKAKITDDELADLLARFGFVGPIQDATTHLVSFGDELRDLSQAFTQLAQVSGDTFGGIVQDIARVTTALDLATRSVGAIRNSQTAAQTAAGAIGAAGAVASATGSGSTASRIAGGAATGAEIGSIFPGVGTAVGAGVGAFIGWLRSRGPSDAEKDARKLEKSFEDAFGGFANSVNTLGQAFRDLGGSSEDAQKAFKALLDAEKQGPDAVQAQINALQGVIDKAAQLRAAASQFGPSQQDLKDLAQQAKDTYDYMLRSGQYTAAQLAAALKASTDAQRRALGEPVDAINEQAKAAEAVLGKLKDQYKSLADSIANEAPEEVAGVIETNTRAQLETLQHQIDEQQAQLAALADTAASDIEDALSAIHPDPIHVPIEWDIPPLPGTETAGVSGGMVTPFGIQHFAAGGNVLPFFRPMGTDTVPAMLTPGEMVLTRQQQQAVFGGGSTRPIELTVYSVLDGQIVSQSNARYTAASLQLRQKRPAA